MRFTNGAILGHQCLMLRLGGVVVNHLIANKQQQSRQSWANLGTTCRLMAAFPFIQPNT
jgi:hypothetical protein